MVIVSVLVVKDAEAHTGVVWLATLTRFRKLLVIITCFENARSRRAVTRMEKVIKEMRFTCTEE